MGAPGAVRRRSPIRERSARAASRAARAPTARTAGAASATEVWARPRGAAGRVVVPLTHRAGCPPPHGRGVPSLRRAARGRHGADPLPGRGRTSPPADENGSRPRSGRARAAGCIVGARRPPRRRGRPPPTISTAARLRPYALADAWGADRRAVLELCLLATRAGLLESRWEVVCPLCRGAADSTDALAGVDSHVHCDSCQIDVTRRLRAVDRARRSGRARRSARSRRTTSASAGPASHLTSSPSSCSRRVSSRDVSLALEPGAYRMRTLGLEGSTEVRSWMPERPDRRSPSSTTPPRSGWSSLERTAWNDQAATAADVTSLQAFRDLFAAEALRPGREHGRRKPHDPLHRPSRLDAPLP